MKALTKPQNEFILDILNEWAFKEFILTYAELNFVKKVFHKTGEYDETGATVLNGIRTKWIKYHKKEYDHKLSGQWLTKQGRLKSYK